MRCCVKELVTVLEVGRLNVQTFAGELGMLLLDLYEGAGKKVDTFWITKIAK
jgi:hypothetical protein